MSILLNKLILFNSHGRTKQTLKYTFKDIDIESIDEYKYI